MAGSSFACCTWAVQSWQDSNDGGASKGCRNYSLELGAHAAPTCECRGNSSMRCKLFYIAQNSSMRCKLLYCTEVWKAASCTIQLRRLAPSCSLRSLAPVFFVKHRQVCQAWGSQHFGGAPLVYAQHLMHIAACDGPSCQHANQIPLSN